MKKKELTPRQIKAAAIEANPDNWKLTQTAKAETLGISTSTLLRWQKLPIYRAHVNKLVREYAEKLLPKAWACLEKRMETDTQALKLYFTLTGQLVERPQVSNAISIGALAGLTTEEREELLAEAMQEGIE